MRKLIVVNIMSLDGYYEGPGRNVMVMPMDGAFDTYNLERMQHADTVLLGGHSYRMFSSFWPAMVNHPDASPTNREFSRLYNLVEKVAVSNHLTLEDSAPWRGTTTIICSNHVYDEIAALKRKPGKDIFVYGSRTLWNDLLAHGLIDELHFMIGNVVIGGGTPIFIEPIAYNDPKLTLRHIDTRKFEGSENVLVQYKVEYEQKG
ncbi:MAG: bifunctional deaminase-reductase domain protein [Brevibacillus sp.]|nr:bifunctional deaminase-reductase domain protein [Brevibacillus sp.]